MGIKTNSERREEEWKEQDRRREEGYSKEEMREYYKGLGNKGGKVRNKSGKGGNKTGSLGDGGIWEWERSSPFLFKRFLLLSSSRVLWSSFFCFQRSKCKSFRGLWRIVQVCHHRHSISDTCFLLLSDWINLEVCLECPSAKEHSVCKKRGRDSIRVVKRGSAGQAQRRQIQKMVVHFQVLISWKGEWARYLDFGGICGPFAWRVEGWETLGSAFGTIINQLVHPKLFSGRLCQSVVRLLGAFVLRPHPWSLLFFRGLMSIGSALSIYWQIAWASGLEGLRGRIDSQLSLSRDAPQ